MDHVSRIEAAEILGFASEFKVRQMERAGVLRAERGVMGSAWYPRAAVVALRQGARPVPVADGARGGSPAPAAKMVAEPRWPAVEARSSGSQAPSTPAGGLGRGGRRPSDAELIAYLRQGRAATVADLVVDTGISIARAQRVHRFWLAHDTHLAGNRVWTGGDGRETVRPSAVIETAPPARPPPALPGAQPGERRSAERLSRATLIKQLRSPDPAARKAAFEALKSLPGATDRRR